MIKSKFVFAYLYVVFPLLLFFFFAGVWFFSGLGVAAGDEAGAKAFFWIGVIWMGMGGTVIFITLKKMVVVRIYPAGRILGSWEATGLPTRS